MTLLALSYIEAVETLDDREWKVCVGLDMDILLPELNVYNLGWPGLCITVEVRDMVGDVEGIKSACRRFASLIGDIVSSS